MIIVLFINEQIRSRGAIGEQSPSATSVSMQKCQIDRGSRAAGACFPLCCLPAASI
jgi:hypothetical protein